jgi:hypothetical protein
VSNLIKPQLIQARIASTSAWSAMRFGLPLGGENA